MTRIVDAVADPAGACAAAVDELKSGGLVILPTETVYGLAALSFIDGTIDAIFERKVDLRGEHGSEHG